jgi:hypothetical protein
MRRRRRKRRRRRRKRRRGKKYTVRFIHVHVIKSFRLFTITDLRMLLLLTRSVFTFHYTTYYL